MTKEPQGDKIYSFQHASKLPEERARLDALHEAFTAYFGGKLCLAPVEDNPPKTILEMGAGSGAWAIQAATTFTEAEILAVDLAEIPSRPLPANLKFRVVDLAEPVDFDPKVFDLVHARLIIMHLPNYKDILKRTADLVKPGGWLVIDDPNNTLYDDTGAELAPPLDTWIRSWKNVLKARNVELDAVLEYEELLNKCGNFSEVNVHKVSVPISSQSDDPVLNHLGSTIKTTLNSIYPQTATRLADEGLTPDMAERALVEINDDSRKISLDFYFIWARKHL